ncbi:MAG: hypothetical protein HC831_25290 [Chloroflexia bacterium]|nr:hypothetical protein [Chloroflexia bacterium]
MENLIALIYKGNLNTYQKALAQRGFEGLIKRLKIYEKAVKNNAILPLVSKSLKCDCKHSGSCRYEEVIVETKELCRHKE